MVAVTAAPLRLPVDGISRLVFEWGLVLCAAPVLMFPLTAPVLTAVVMAAVAVPIVADAILDRQAWSWLRRRTGHMALPCLVLSIFVCVGAWISPFPRLTAPKFCGLILGGLVFRAVLVTATSRARIRALVLAYVVSGTALVLSGVIVTPSWPDKIKFLRALAMKIPGLVQGLPGAESGVNANALGGSTLFFLPFILVLAASRFWRDRPPMRRRDMLIYASAALLLGFVLLLSQSRTAWVSGLVSTGVLLAAGLRAPRWVRALLLASGVATALALAVWLWPAPAERPSLATAFGGRALAWSLALQAIAAHPVAGIGLGAFRGVAPAMYPSPVPLEVANAHNVFLQVALDLGIPGLIAYLALLVVATKMTFECARRGGEAAALCFGLWSSLVAVHLFGLTDAIAPGAKIGVFLWWNLALIAALHALVHGRASRAAGAGAEQRQE